MNLLVNIDSSDPLVPALLGTLIGRQVAVITRGTGFLLGQLRTAGIDEIVVMHDDKTLFAEHTRILTLSVIPDEQ
jgi:hypothetical protein